MARTETAAEQRAWALAARFDEAALLSVFARIAFGQTGLRAEDLPALAAARRVAPHLFEGGIESFADHLRGMSAHQIEGLASSVKGALHEMEFVDMANARHDGVYASLFEDPHHPDTDVHFVDSNTGAEWDTQLKATDSPPYVQDWIDRHPGGDIRVTDELADRMGIPGTGIDNHTLTLSTDRFLDHLQHIPDHAEVWHYVPVIAPLSGAWAIYQLHQRYRRGDLNWEQFQRRAIWISGLKASKVVLVGTLLAIPGVNAVTATVLMARLIIVGGNMAGRMPMFRSAPLA